MMAIRNLLISVFVVALSMFALSAQGQVTKIYGLTMTPKPTFTTNAAGSQIVDTTAGVKVLVALTNEAPPSDASSTISSFSMQVVVPGVFIKGVDPTGNVVNSTGKTITASTGNVLQTSTTTFQVTAIKPPLKGKQTFIATIYLTSCGDAKWDATVYTGQISGQTFNRDDANSNLLTLVPCGTNIACGDSPLIQSDVGHGVLAALVHGRYNKDGSCASTSFFATKVPILNDQYQFHFRWPVDTSTANDAQPGAAFAYTLTINRSTIDLGWKNSDGSSATSGDGTTTSPVYIHAPVCLNGTMPTPYGSLSQPVDASLTSTQLKVNTSPNKGGVLPVPPTPFPITIGTERMQVMAISGTTWTVARGQGKADNSDAGPHAAGALVVSTPLPLLADISPSTLADGTTVVDPSPYHLNDQAQVCILAAPAPVPDSDPAQWTVNIIDIGDAWGVPR